MFRAGMFVCPGCISSGNDVTVSITDLEHAKKVYCIPLPPFLLICETKCLKCHFISIMRVPIKGVCKNETKSNKSDNQPR